MKWFDCRRLVRKESCFFKGRIFKEYLSKFICSVSFQFVVNVIYFCVVLLFKQFSFFYDDLMISFLFSKTSVSARMLTDPKVKYSNTYACALYVNKNDL